MGWHPCLRCDPALTFWPEGQGEARPAAAWGGGEGTLVVLHGRGHEHPWVLLTDTPPGRTEATLYACRDWIEQGFRGLKRAGWQWQRTRRTDPVRAGRHWLVLAVATLLAVAHGTRREEAATLGRNPTRLCTPPATAPSRPNPAVKQTEPGVSEQLLGFGVHGGYTAGIDSGSFSPQTVGATKSVAWQPIQIGLTTACRSCV